MLTKSLHTVTAVTKVALHLRYTNPKADAAEWVSDALAVLGYDSADFDDDDPTYAACIKSVTKAVQS